MLLRRTTSFWGGVFAVFLVLAAALIALTSNAAPANTITAQSFEPQVSGEQSGSPFFIGSEYLSPEHKLKKSAQAFGFTWQGEQSADFSIKIKTSRGWSDWKRVPVSEEYLVKDGTGPAGTDLLFTEPAKAFQYRYHSNLPIEGVKAFALSTGTNSPINLLQKFIGLFVPQTKARVDVASRADWGANEDVSTWEPEYAQPEKFIVHHTTSSDGLENPESVIQAIQYWHAVAMGWGDIGYNYLIDANGNVYEGRKGGDGAIGAHAYRSSICNQHRFGGERTGLDFNQGTIGIALLGNYEENEPSEAATESLSQLIAEKGRLFGIVPNGESDFQDLEALPNVSGHKDVDCTLCPGKNLEVLLTDVRRLSRRYYDGLGSTRSIRAELVSISATEFELEKGKTTSVWIDYRNVGDATWRQNGPMAVSLTAANSPSSLADSSWFSPDTPAKPASASVAPGEIGRFEFTIRAPSDQLDVTETFRLTYKGLPLLRTDVQLSLTVAGLDWAGRPSKQSIHEKTFLGARLPVVLKFKNAGTKTWTKSNIFLYIYDLAGAASRYHDQGWSEPDGKISLKEARVAPGKIGTFEFLETSPTDPGKFMQIFRLIAEGQLVINSEMSMVTQTESMYKARLISDTFPLAVRTGWRPSVTLKFKNTGVRAWDKNMKLELFDSGFERSRFFNPAWPEVNGSVGLNESSVKPGEIGTFTIQLQAPKTSGLFLNLLRLASKNYPYQVQGGSGARIIRVD